MPPAPSLNAATASPPPRQATPSTLFQFLLSLGCLLLVKARGATLPLRSLLCLGCPLLMLVSGLCVLLGKLSLLRRTLAFPLDLALDIGCFSGVDFGLLPVVSGLPCQDGALSPAPFGTPPQRERLRVRPRSAQR